MSGTLERKVMDYSIFYTGRWGRNRSVKSDNQRLLRVDVDAVDAVTTDQIKTAVNAMLATIHAKPGLAWHVTRAPVTLITEPGQKFVTESFTMFSAVRVMAGTVA